MERGYVPKEPGGVSYCICGGKLELGHAMVEIFEVGVEQEVGFCHGGTKGRRSRHFAKKNLL
jgi:hypothetical protein